MTDPTRQAFEFFLHSFLDAWSNNTPAKLGWTATAVARANTEPSLFFCMAALGSAQLSISSTFDSALSRAPPELGGVGENLTLKHYAASVSHLRRTIQNKSFAGQDIELILSCCLLLMMYEVVQGDLPAAIQHMRMARAIAAQDVSTNHQPRSSNLQKLLWHLQAPGCDPSVPPDPLPPEIDDQSILDLSPVVPSRCTIFASVAHAYICSEQSLASARTIQQNLLDLAFSAIGRDKDNLSGLSTAQRFCLALCFSRATVLARSSELNARLRKTLDTHGCCRMGLVELSGDGSLASESIASLLLAQVRILLSDFTLSICRETRANVTDRFNGHCSEAVVLIERYLGHSTDLQVPTPEEATKPHRAGLFRFGILNALFTMCCKCRDATIRCQALSLLRGAKRIEWSYNSETLAVYAETIIQIEQQRARSLLASSMLAGDICATTAGASLEIPEMARFADVAISDRAADGETFIIHGARFAHERHGEIELWEYTCTPLRHEAETVAFETTDMTMADEVSTTTTPIAFTYESIDSDAPLLRTRRRVELVSQLTVNQIDDWSCQSNLADLASLLGRQRIEEQGSD